MMKWISLSMLLLFVASFALMGPIPYVIMSELFPVHLRTIGMGIASATSWGTLNTFAYSLLESRLGKNWLFAGFCLVCAVAWLISFSFCPETQGQSLESVEEKLHKGVGLRKIGR